MKKEGRKEERGRERGEERRREKGQEEDREGGKEPSLSLLENHLYWSLVYLLFLLKNMSERFDIFAHSVSFSHEDGPRSTLLCKFPLSLFEALVSILTSLGCRGWSHEQDRQNRGAPECQTFQGP